MQTPALVGDIHTQMTTRPAGLPWHVGISGAIGRAVAQKDRGIADNHRDGSALVALWRLFQDPDELTGVDVAELRTACRGKPELARLVTRRIAKLEGVAA